MYKILFVLLLAYSSAKIRQKVLPSVLHSELRNEIRAVVEHVIDAIKRTDLALFEVSRATPTHTRLIISPGKYCIYNSECSGCDVGLSQECIANRCQCRPVYNPIWSSISHAGSNVDCANAHLANPALVYYDHGHQRCIVEKIKESKKVYDCGQHYNITSIVDRVTYCLDALDSLDTVCYDNEMCQQTIQSKSFIGKCINGICHAMSVKNFTEYIINDNTCKYNILTHCEEVEHKHLTPSLEKHKICTDSCFYKTRKGGVASKVNETCLCLTPSSKPPSKLPVTLANY